MAMKLVPYTNAMRLGQGFNSYTQQICIDDAVVIDNDRAENTLLNDGTTMRILVQTESKASAWTRQKEVVVDDRTYGINKEPLHRPEQLEEDEAQGISMVPEDSLSESELEPPSSKSPNTVRELEPRLAPNEAVTPGGTTQDSAANTSGEVSKADSFQEESVSIGTDVNSADASVTVSSTPDARRSSKDAIPSTRKKTKSSPVDQSTKTSSGVAGKSRKIQDPSNKAGTTITRPLRKSDSVMDRLKGDIALCKAAALKAAEEEMAEVLLAEKERAKLQRIHQREIEEAERQEEMQRRAEDRVEQRAIREEKRKFEEQRRKDMYAAVENASKEKGRALSMAEMATIAKQNQFAERWNGMSEGGGHEYNFDPNTPRGPSQTVTNTSRFIDRLSDITDDMCISGALSIKAAKIGGSGRGSFVDSDKFKESDLTFYISVKVVNQTINFKDALQFKPIRSMTDASFAKVYGDSFISGFQEGGEFNAVVSMKILNKAKKTDIKAEAKVAFTTGPMSVEAEANVGIARENIESNTETTIQVSWCGGGHIKPMEQQWDLKTLMAAAARFPDLVADCPQRTHAILTKYESLRSFVSQLPKSYTKMEYENAQTYTNVLMDAFMTYKALYKQVSDEMFQLKHNTMKVMPWERKDADDAAARATLLLGETVAPGSDAATTATTTTGATELSSTTLKAIKNTQTKTTKDDGFYPFQKDMTRFEASISGLDQARHAMRRQMARIVHEVDLIDRDPALATDEDHDEPFQAPASFELRLPTVDIPEHLQSQQGKQAPLTGKRILANKTLSETERNKETARLEELSKAPGLYGDADGAMLEGDEIKALERIVELDPSLGYFFNVTGGLGGTKTAMHSGKQILNADRFNMLDFVKKDWEVRSIEATHSKGMLRSVTVRYMNGLQATQGDLVRSDVTKHVLNSFSAGERIISCTIETGIWAKSHGNSILVLGLELYTNRGRSLLARAQQNRPVGDTGAVKDGYEYNNLVVRHYDSPYSQGTLKGFFGYALDEHGVFRLGCIWGDKDDSPANDSNSDSQATPVASGEEKPAPAPTALVLKTERRVLPSQWGQTMSRNLNVGDGGSVIHTASFGFNYPTTPTILHAFNEVRTGDKNSPASWDASSIVATTSGFTASIQPFCSGFQQLTYSWMTLPDNEVNFNSGTYDFDSLVADTKENCQVSTQITFAKPYTEAPPTPAIWCVSLDFSGTDVQGAARLQGRAEDVTATGFKLVIESFDGGRHAGNVWGWCAWDRQYDGIKVKSAVSSIGNRTDMSKNNLSYWEPDFGGLAKSRPVAIMTGIRGLDVDFSDEGKFHVKSQWAGGLEDGGIVYGTDSYSQARWVECMYLAIMEN